MYMTKDFPNKKLMGVRGYKSMNIHCLMPLTRTVNSCLPEGKLMDFSTPKIVTASYNKLRFNVGFEYRY